MVTVVSLRNQTDKIMHLTLNIQSILQFAFITIMVAPLPLLLLSSPIQYVTDKIKYRKYYSIVKRTYSDPESISKEQLRDLFPKLQTEELTHILFHLREGGSYAQNSYTDN
jgi:hypothetical protein